MQDIKGTFIRPRTKLAALAGVAVLAMAAGPAVGPATAATKKKTTTTKKAAAIKPKAVVVTIDPTLASAVQTAGISFGPFAPATSVGTGSIKMKSSGSLALSGKKLKKSTLTLSGGISLDATALIGQTIPIKNLKMTINGATGLVVADIDLLGGSTSVLDISGVTVSGKKVTGNLAFDAGVGDKLGAVLPAAATGKPFGTFVAQ